MNIFIENDLPSSNPINSRTTVVRYTTGNLRMVDSSSGTLIARRSIKTLELECT